MLFYPLYLCIYKGNRKLKIHGDKIITREILEDDINKYQFLIIIEVYKKYFRNEKLIIMFCLNFLFNKKIDDLENINFL